MQDQETAPSARPRSGAGAGPGRAQPLLHRPAAALAGLAVWQLASGLSNVVLGWPIVAALAHTGGAAALVVVLTTIVVRTRTARASPAVVPERDLALGAIS